MASLSAGTSSPAASATSQAITPCPPPSVSTATRRPRGTAGCCSASSTSASSRGVRTWIAPATAQAAVITAASLVSEPVCDWAPRAAAVLAPAASTTTGVPAATAAAAASTNPRPSRKSST